MTLRKVVYVAHCEQCGEVEVPAGRDPDRWATSHEKATGHRVTHVEGLIQAPGQ